MPITTMPLGVTAVMLPELDLAQQLALCKQLGITHYCVRPRVIPEAQVGKPYSNWGNHKFDLTPQRLLKEAAAIKKQINDAGLTVFGSVPACSIDSPVEELKLNFEGAAAVGAGRVRVAPHRVPAGPFDYAQELARNHAGFAKAIELAKPYGVKLVIETHAGSFATSPGLALKLCEPFPASAIGTIFDIANFNIEGKVQPHYAVAVLADYIDHVHIGGVRQQAGVHDEFGFRKADFTMCPVTEASLYIPDWIAALHAAGRDVPLLIEDYTPNKPGAWRLTDSAVALRRVLEGLPA